MISVANKTSSTGNYRILNFFYFFAIFETNIEICLSFEKKMKIVQINDVVVDYMYLHQNLA